jgi:hypothetical protein
MLPTEPLRSSNGIEGSNSNVITKMYKRHIHTLGRLHKKVHEKEQMLWEKCVRK